MEGENFEVINVKTANKRYEKSYISAKDKPQGLQLSLEEIENRYGPSGRKIVEVTEQKAKEILTDFSRDTSGDPVLTGLIDSKTGEIFFGRNISNDRELKNFIKELHPVLKARLEIHATHVSEGKLKASEIDILKAGIPGSHSEIVAIDQALKARGLYSDESVLTDFIMHNKKLGGVKNNKDIPIGVPPRCVHCWYLTNNIKTIGND